MPDPNLPTRTVTTNGVDLHVVDAGRDRPSCSPTGSPSCRTRGATRSRRWPTPATACSRPTSAATAARPARARSRTTTSSTSPTTCSACSTTSARSRRCSSATTGARWSCGSWRCCTPSASPASSGMSVPFLPRGPMPPIQLMRQVFGDTFFYILYFQEPGVADADLGRDPATTMRRMLAGLRLPEGRRRFDVAAASAPDGRGFVDRLPEPDGLPDWLTPGRARPLHRRVHPHRLHRRHQLVPQLRPQLGAHRRSSTAPRSTVPSLFIGGSARPGAAHEPARGHGRLARPTTAATCSSTAPATGCSRSVPRRSTPRCSTSSANSSSRLRVLTSGHRRPGGNVAKPMHDTHRLPFDGAVDADGHILEPPDLWETLPRAEVPRPGAAASCSTRTASRSSRSAASGRR